MTKFFTKISVVLIATLLFSILSTTTVDANVRTLFARSALGLEHISGLTYFAPNRSLDIMLIQYDTYHALRAQMGSGSGTFGFITSIAPQNPLTPATNMHNTPVVQSMSRASARDIQTMRTARDNNRSAEITFNVLGHITNVRERGVGQEWTPPRNISVTTTADPAQGGRVTSGSLYHMNERTSIIATPNTGWEFVGWFEGNTRISTNRQLQLTVTQDRNLAARFRRVDNQTSSNQQQTQPPQQLPQQQPPQQQPPQQQPPQTQQPPSNQARNVTLRENQNRTTGTTNETVFQFRATTDFDATRVVIEFSGGGRFNMNRTNARAWYLNSRLTTAGAQTATVHAYEGNTRRASHSMQVSTTATPATQNPNITTTSLSGGTVGMAYRQNLTATGTGNIQWRIPTGTGSLPPGLTIHADGSIFGTPTTAGTFNFTVEARNNNGTVTRPLSITIAAAAEQAPRITTVSLPDTNIGSNRYAFLGGWMLEATGTTPITWRVSSGSLPNGLSLRESRGNTYIYGWPTTAGNFVFTLEARNNAGITTRELSITVSSARANISISTLGEGSVIKTSGNTVIEHRGDDFVVYYGEQITVRAIPNNGWEFVRWEELGGEGGGVATVISQRSENFTFTATSSRHLRATFRRIDAPEILTDSLGLPNGRVGVAYSYGLVARSSRPVTFSLGATGSSGDVYFASLPYGLHLNRNTGVISGTPTSAGIFIFRISVSNGNYETRQFFELTINP